MNKSELIEYYEKKLSSAKRCARLYKTKGFINANNETIDRISSLLKVLKI